MRKNLLITIVLVMVLVSSLSMMVFAKTNLKVWFYPDSNEIKTWENIFTKFEAENPDIELETLQLPVAQSNYQKLLTSIVAGTAPDVVLYFDRFNTASWAARGAMIPLDKYVKQTNISADSFYESNWNEVVYDGHVWALPNETDARILFYNKDHLKELGLEKPPVNLTEFTEVAHKLSKRDADGNLERVGFVPWYWEGWLYTWGFAAGADFYDQDAKEITLAGNEKLIKILNWLQDYAEYYGGADVLEEFTTNAGTAGQDPFSNGDLSMVIGGPWNISYFNTYSEDLNFDYTVIPYPEYGEEATWSGGHANFIVKGSKHPDEAWKLVEFMSLGEGNTIFNKETTHIPPRKEVAVEMYEGTSLEEFTVLLESARTRPPLPVGGLLWDELVRVRDYVIRGEAPEKMLQEADEKVTKALNKLQ